MKNWQIIEHEKRKKARTKDQVSVFFFALILVIIMAAFSRCSTPQKSLQTTSSLTKSDSSLQSVKTFIAVSDSCNTIPAVSGEIEFTLSVDSTGKISPINLDLKQGVSGMSIEATGKNTFKAKYNCEASINRLRKELFSTDSLLKSIRSSDSSKARIETKIEVQYKTPVWNIVGFTLLIVTILFLAGYIIYSKISITNLLNRK